MFFQYVVAFAVSLAVTAAVGGVLVPSLRRSKAGQMIREDGPVWHNKKQGTPTMGGIMFIIGIAVACPVAGTWQLLEGDLTYIYVFALGLAFAAIGFIDDFMKIRKKRNLGLKARYKFLLQVAVAALFIFLMRLYGNLATILYIPFFDVAFHIPEPVYYVFAAFVAVGTVNSVNITDGADGLVSGVTIPVAAFFAVVSFAWGFTTLGMFASAIIGGLAAFLIFNFYPAKVFMGDTGAQFLGGAVCAMAFACNMPLILIPLGIVYFIETLSDIIQVVYFKLSHGKRVFKMAPLHHHFEMCGWGERKLFVVFTAVSVAFAAISFYAILII